MNNRNNQQKDAIRLTNRTARALREQAKQQRTALYVLATVVAVALCAAAVILGIGRLIAVPVCVLIAMALDTLIILLARGRYLSLTGQAICVEAAARQLRGESAEARTRKKKRKKRRTRTCVLPPRRSGRRSPRPSRARRRRTRRAR